MIKLKKKYIKKGFKTKKNSNKNNETKFDIKII